MRGHAVERRPARDAERFERLGIEAVRLAALIERGERDAGVRDDVGAGGILEAAVRAEPRPERGPRRIHQAAPQRAARFLLGHQAARAHETIAIADLAAAEIQLVDHRVAVERVIAAERLVNLVLGVAQVDAVEIGGHGALEHRQVVRGDFLVLRRPRARQVGMVAVPQRGPDGRELLESHCRSLPKAGRLYAPIVSLCKLVGAQQRRIDSRQDAKTPRNAKKIWVRNS